MFFSWDGNENYTFTIVRQPDTVLLVIKPPESIVSDTVKFVAPVAKKFLERIYAVEGYLLLEGRYSLNDNKKKDQMEEVSFDLAGNIISSKWKSYKLVGASIILEDKTFGNPWTFLVDLKSLNGVVENRVLLFYGKNKMELYKYTREKTGYVLDVNSKITLVAL